MNVMTLTLVAVYAIAVIVIGVCVLRNMFRSVLRGSVALGLTLIALPLSVLVARATVDGLTSKILHMIDLSAVAQLEEAFPSLEDSAVALVHMVAAPEIGRLVFVLVLTVFAVLTAVVCHFIEKAKPSLAKRNKAIGAALGAVCGVVMVVGILSPTAGYSVEAPGAVHTLEEYEQITHMDEQTLQQTIEAEKNALKVSNTPLLAAVRALGGEAIFDSLTTVTVDGHETDLHTELHALDRLGADIAALSAVPMEEYTDREYDTIREIGDVLEDSVLLRVLGAEGVSALSRAWLKDRAFLGIDRPDAGEAMNFAMNAIMVVMKNTNKDTVAHDVRALAPAISAALRVHVAQTPKPSEPGADPEATPEPPTTSEQLDVLMDAIVESAETPETKDVLVRAGVGLVANELEQYLVNGVEPKPEKPADPDTPEGSEEPVIAVLPNFDPATIPEDTNITQEEYDSFVDNLTDYAIAGGFVAEQTDIVEDVKGIRDLVGIDLTDEMCESLVAGVLESPYASLFR